MLETSEPPLRFAFGSGLLESSMFFFVILASSGVSAGVRYVIEAVARIQA